MPTLTVTFSNHAAERWRERCGDSDDPTPSGLVRAYHESRLLSRTDPMPCARTPGKEYRYHAATDSYLVVDPSKYGARHVRSIVTVISGNRERNRPVTLTPKKKAKAEAPAAVDVSAEESPAVAVEDAAVATSPDPKPVTPDGRAVELAQEIDWHDPARFGTLKGERKYLEKLCAAVNALSASLKSNDPGRAVLKRALKRLDAFLASNKDRSQQALEASTHGRE